MCRYFCAYTLPSVVGNVATVVVLDVMAIDMGDAGTTGVLAEFQVRGRIGEGTSGMIIMAFKGMGNITGILDVIVQGVDFT